MVRSVTGAHLPESESQRSPFYTAGLREVEHALCASVPLSGRLQAHTHRSTNAPCLLCINVINRISGK